LKQSRDPRFLPLAGEFSAEKFQAHYSFLGDAHKAELDTLRENLKRARKLLANSPRISFEERNNEVKRLQLAVKRAESMVNKDRQDVTEREALLKLTSEEKEKRKQGKQHWWLKECECYHQ
jgi:ribosomal RNA-processing protein 36